MSKAASILKRFPVTPWFFAALAVGMLFRLIWPYDIEYKYDEHYMFERVMALGKTEGWRWLGMSSGAGGVQNPGMSIWIFQILGKLFLVDSAPALARVVQLLNCGALIFMAWFAFKKVSEKEREPWLWATAMVALNPLAVLYERKIWAQSVLPLFCMIFLYGWWNREKRKGALIWGLLGACLGQIHMSGFFFAFAFVVWSVIWERRKPNWTGWFFGSFLGSLPLLPWVFYMLQKGPTNAFMELSASFYGYWASDPLGLGLGYSLGVHRSPGLIEQFGDFWAHPVIAGQETYLMLGLHAFLLLLGAAVILYSAFQVFITWSKRPGTWKDLISGRTTNSAFAQQAALLGFGGLITASQFVIHRHYLLITFPLEFIWFARQTLKLKQPWGKRALIGLVVAHLFITATFLGYIHVKGGAPDGDYGKAYRHYVAPIPATIFD